MQPEGRLGNIQGWGGKATVRTFAQPASTDPHSSPPQASSITQTAHIMADVADAAPEVPQEAPPAAEGPAGEAGEAEQPAGEEEQQPAGEEEQQEEPKTAPKKRTPRAKPAATPATEGTEGRARRERKQVGPGIGQLRSLISGLAKR